jgi:hypothetical protein
MCYTTERKRDVFFVILEIILRDFLGAILRGLLNPTAARMRMPRA